MISIGNLWSVRSESFDDYCAAVEHVKPLGMNLKQLRTIETITLNLIVGGVAVVAIYAGAEPTLVGLAALSGLGLLNGIKVSEWAAAAQWLAEARAATLEGEGLEAAAEGNQEQEQNQEQDRDRPGPARDPGVDEQD